MGGELPSDRHADWAEMLRSAEGLLGSASDPLEALLTHLDQWLAGDQRRVAWLVRSDPGPRGREQPASERQDPFDQLRELLERTARQSGFSDPVGLTAQLLLLVQGTAIATLAGTSSSLRTVADGVVASARSDDTGH